MAKGKLSEAVKTFVVQSLPYFDTTSIVVDTVRRECGQALDSQSKGIIRTRRLEAIFQRSGRALFEEKRKSFVEDTATIAISHHAVGFVRYSAFTNRSEHTGKNGRPIQTETRSWRDVLRQKGSYHFLLTPSGDWCNGN